MTFTKEQISQAFIEVLNERTPDLSGIPDHVFSVRFEKKMQKLIDREAAHPWAVSHTAVRNLLIAAIVLIMMLVLCMSVSGIRSAIFHFFVEHFDVYNEVVFDASERTEIEHAYEITNLPKGFILKQRIETIGQNCCMYESPAGETISFWQSVPSLSSGTIIDNERSTETIIESEEQVLYYSHFPEYEQRLAWEMDGYEFWISINSRQLQFEDLLALYHSIQ